MKIYDVYKSFHRIGSLRTVAVGLCCVVFYFLCGSCRSSRAVSRSSTIERHEIFDNTFAADSLDVSGTVTQSDSATVNISCSGNDTIRIERDEAGRPVLIIRNYASNAHRSLGISQIYDLDFTGYNMSRRNESAGTVDNLDQKKEESKTEVDPAISLRNIIAPGLLCLAILYVLYVIIVDGIWPHLKKLISTRLSRK